MLEQVKYINHMNEVIDFGKNGIYLNENELRQFAWSIVSKNDRISSFKKGITSKKLPLTIKCNSEEEGVATKNRLYEICEKDVLAKKHGKLIIGDYYLKCFVIGSKPSEYLKSKSYMKTDITISTDMASWYKETTTIFRPKSALNTSESAEGKEILIGNASNSVLIKYGADGYTQQKTLSGKNLLPSSGLVETTNNGITFTPVYEDGLLQYINANGTATANVAYSISTQTLENGSYILNGCMDGSTSTYILTVRTSKNGTNTWYNNTTSDKAFTISDTETFGSCCIQVKSGVTVSNVKIYPMIRLATETDSTYGPYCGGTASPNPDYPQDIQGLADDGILTVQTIAGENLYDGGGTTTANIPLDAPLYDGDYIEYFADGTGQIVRNNYEFNVASSDCRGMGYQNNHTEITLPIQAVPSPNTTTDTTLFSTHFTGGIRNSIYFGTQQAISIASTGLFLIMRIDGYTTLSEYKSWLDSANCKVIYKLAEPIMTPLTAEQVNEFKKLMTFEGATRIANEGNTNQKVTYSIKQYLDHPFDFPFDYTAEFDTDELINTSFMAVDFRMIIHGFVANPSIYIAEHEYNVNVTVEEGDYLTIDSQNKTIILSKLDGTQINCFNLRNRDSYIFEKIPVGSNKITSPDDLNIDITLLDERGVPLWT